MAKTDNCHIQIAFVCTTPCKNSTGEQIQIVPKNAGASERKDMYSSYNNGWGHLMDLVHYSNNWQFPMSLWTYFDIQLLGKRDCFSGYSGQLEAGKMPVAQNMVSDNPCHKTCKMHLNASPN